MLEAAHSRSHEAECAARGGLASIILSNATIRAGRLTNDDVAETDIDLIIRPRDASTDAHHKADANLGKRMRSCVSR